MNDRQLEIFLKVSECRSFARAERELFLSRQAIMKQIDRMEAELGVRLFVRTSAGLTLTPAGDVLRTGLEPIRRDMQKLIAACQRASQATAKLRIEIPRHPRSLIDRPIALFRERFPHVQLDIARSTSAGRIQRLREGKIDVAEMPYREELEGSGLAFVHLVDRPFLCLMANAHPLSGHTSLNAKELSAYPVYVSSLSARRRLIEHLRTEAPELTIREITGDEMDAIPNVCYNYGIYLTPAFFAERMEYLTAVPLACAITQEIVLICGAEPNEWVSSFMVIAKEAVRQQT